MLPTKSRGFFLPRFAHSALNPVDGPNLAPPSRLTVWGHRRVPHFRSRLTGHCFWQPPAEQAQEAIEDGQGMRRAAGDE